MATEIVEPLYNIVKSFVFGKRNLDKAANGDIGRSLVAIAQFNNAATATSTCNNSAGRIAKVYVNAIEKASTNKTALGYTAKGLKIASKYVNPLIVLSAGIKVARADDKKSEAIKQGCALTTMFSAEKMAKTILTQEGREAFGKSKIANKKLIKNILETMNKIDKYAKNANSSKICKIGIPVAKALAFVCVSITGYAVGASIADKINNARLTKDFAENNTNSPNEPEKTNYVQKNTDKKPLNIIS